MMISAEPQPIRVLLVDDHATFLWGLEKLIESERSRIEVVGKARNPGEMLRAARIHDLDVIVLDVDLAGVNTIDLLPELLVETSARVLMLTGSRDPRLAERARQRGAHGFLTKDAPAELIIQAIEQAFATARRSADL
jgi:two-component system, NarL family, nitrate/nitrite response regulator NarL